MSDAKKKGPSYGTYLKVKELLSLQAPLSSPEEHDELLFIVIHQVYELWFRQMIHEVEEIRSASAQADARRCGQVYRRLIEIQRVLLQQISVLETMTPVDFARFRDHLNPASGFQSRQFRELEFMSGMKDRELVRHLEHDPADVDLLKERLEEPTLKDCLDTLLTRAGFDLPAPGKGDDELRATARLDALHSVYKDPSAHFDLYLLCEAMIEYDENFSLWRHRHILMVERMIGRKRGTGGTEGVGYLATTLKKRSFPELWEVRTRIGGGSW